MSFSLFNTVMLSALTAVRCNSWTRLTAILICSVMLCGHAMASGQEDGEQFSIATLNVDGLPQKILMVNVNANGPGNSGTARIGKYLLKKGYDLVMMQEDFNYHDILTVFLEDEYQFDEWTGDVEVVDHKIDYLHLQNHRFECDGLMACWKNDLTVTPVARTPWQQNFGKFSHAMDEMVTKGYRRYEVILRGGQRIVVYNMHLDASDSNDVPEQRDTKDREARIAQWEQLKEDVLQNLDTCPIIITGDLNCLYTRDDVKGVFFDAISKTGRGTVYDVWDVLKRQEEETFDKILYINPATGTQIQPVAFSLDNDGYLYEGKRLGDHCPVAATFKVVSNTTGIGKVEKSADGESELFYNLNGQRVSHPRNGIYIERNGEKSGKRIVK